MKWTYFLLIAVLISSSAFAQDEDDAKEDDKERHSVSISNKGIDIDSKNKEEKVLEANFAMLDLGFNMLMDNTNYSSAAARNFLNVDASMQNEDLFNLRTGKSINVNIYPAMLQYRLLKTKGQKVYLSTGVGLQMYNFRFDKDISYVNITKPEVIMDSADFSKNKLGFTYLSVPLMFTFKTRLVEDNWLIYGFGVTGGYRIASWTKQKSALRGKDKNHDKFNFNDYNACVTAEIGLEGYFRLYASYQVTALHENALDQHPFCIGLRFMGI